MDSGRRLSASIWEWPLQRQDGVVTVHNDADIFEADLEVPTFRPNEIDVKVMKDELVVHCYQEQGFDRTPREIHRTYVLPPDVDLKTLKSTIKSDGILKISAAKKHL